jgi:outer membrane lipoprotein carrier protein
MNKFLPLCLLFISHFTFAQTNEFSQFFNHFETLSADFKQYTFGVQGTKTTQITGNLIFKRPRQLIWQTKTPNEQTLLLNDKKMWLVDFELEQAVQQETNNLDVTPLYWLINRPDTMRIVPKFSHKRDGINWYKTQKENQLLFGFKNKKLKAISLVNELDQTILMVFDKVKINQNLHKDTFKITLNEDFDIIALSNPTH